jgi:hypothetical protein
MGIPTEEYSIGQVAKTSPIVLFFFVRSTHRAVHPRMLRENLVEICGTFPIRQRLAEWQKRERFYVSPFATQPIRSSVVQGTVAIFSHQGTKVEVAAMSLEGNTYLQFQKSVATPAYPLPPHRRSGARSGHARACSDRTRGPGALD